MNNFNLEWHGRELIGEIEDICETAVDDGVKKIVRDARRLVSKDTHDLEKSIHVKKFKKPGVIGAYIKAGAKGKEHATFVELGTPGTTCKQGKRKGQSRTPIKAQPFLRPALKKNTAKIRRAFTNKLK